MRTLTAADPYAEVRRHFSATPEQVFAAFAEKDLVAKWLSPSPDISVTVLDFDFREGGAYRLSYQLPEGLPVVVGGSYRLIRPPSTIVFSWIIEAPDEHAGIPSEVRVTITARGTGTDLVIRHEKLARPDAVSRHAEGWRGALDRLSTILNGGARV